MKNFEKTKRLVLAAVIVAIIILMGFTPIGYIKTPTIEVTFLMIPVVIGAAILGKEWGAIFGLVFGLTSFFQCFGYSPFGTALFAINPVATFIMCLVPRILMGFLAGVIYEAIYKIDKTKIISFIVTSISGAALNTLFFTLGFILFFRNADLTASFGMNLADMRIMDVIGLLITFNAVLEVVICGVVGTALSKVISHLIIKNRTIFGKKN